jgi:molecular chaperone DnaK (HSP70)
MTITGQSSLPKDDIDRMVRDAEQHAEDDRAAARRPRSATTPTRSSTRPRSCCGPGRQVRPATRRTRSRAR